MFKKKVEKPKRNHAGKSLSQYGLFEVPSDFDTGVDNADDDDDDDLEAELAALASGNGPTKPKRPARRVVPQADLDSMIAQSLKDIPSDEEVSGDDDDPDLLNELSAIATDDSEPVESSPGTPPEATPESGTSDICKLLNERLKLYEEAEKVAKTTGETSRARRFNRGIKTLHTMIKEANAGNPVNEADIPPEVRIGPSKSAEPTETNVQPVRPAPQIPISPSEPIPEPEPSEQPPEPKPEPENLTENPREVAQNAALNTELLNMLTQRQKEYKIAALQAKKADDKVTALNYLKIVKQFDMVLEAVKKGEPVDLSRMPGPPGENKPKENVEENHVQQSTHSDPPPAPVEEPEEAGGGLITASSVMEALEQRLAVYKAQESSAKEQGSSSKARRYGRICKQFEDAIKLHKAGKPIDLEELPTPPGYAPIPGSAPPKAPPVVKPAPNPPAPKSSDGENPSPSQPSSANVNKQATTKADKQILILLAKQKQFKVAALNAKKKGEMAEAKEFLRTAKGFDRLIEAAKGGLPIDWASIPVSPDAKSQLDNEYEVVMNDECNDDSTGSLDILTRLENQLTKQLKMCLNTRDHNKALGDVAGMNRFERLALNVTKDLDTVRVAHRTPGAPIPKFHYEKKDFSIVKSFTDLSDNDLELTIVRGVNFTTANPKEIDTYVKFEFPFPQDTPYIDKTATVKDTNNPEYNQMFMIPIQRTSRICQRVFKRHGIKFEVYSKGGFFRSDTLIGTVNVKLQQLNTQCELHDSFDLLEGRKKVGGKLEVHLRLRHPIVTQQVEQIQEKWLVIDQ